MAGHDAERDSQTAGFWQMQAIFGKLRSPEPPVASEPPPPPVALGARPPSGPPRARSDDDEACFDVLGLEPSNDLDANELKRRYRELAKRMHPDRGGRQEDFVQLNRAYALALRMVLARSAG